ncbi:ATPase [Mesorhizobium sp. LNJC399B00]|uniref:helicase HerA-like domain-containing protein n=1 Tax=unclassified Mesorhizobium TaxID=325217 RepID=UPI0003CF5AF2|nr:MULTISPECIES: ATP-binding protein [unclassified Mesorhizobium]ESY03373.1 ATPase [Mesorhizobium sp. LNJC399B00]WJI67247.1 ATP-binding protein [Mesorhizobium sp. C399B]
MAKLQIAPFERSRYLGSITQVNPLEVRVNFPFATEIAPSQYAGHRVTRGQVGEFVVIEGQSLAVLGRIMDIRLPDRDRLSVEPERASDQAEPNPIGTIRLLGSVEIDTGKSTRGIAEAPRIGDYVFLAHPEFIRHAIDITEPTQSGGVYLGHLSGASETRIVISPLALFGRHCAVLGSTGGGKSWTTARLAEQLAALRGKLLLIDPTGEYHTLGGLADHVHLGGQRQDEDDTSHFVSFPYRHLTELDLFALFQPSPGVQAPKLRDAIASLKLLEIVPSLGTDGELIKAFALKKPINSALIQNDGAINAISAKYNIKKLSHQILRECVNLQAGDPKSWGGVHENSQSACVTLSMRIESAIKSPHLSPIFSPEPYMEDLTATFDNFLADKDKRILRVSMRYLPFEHHSRELVVNAIGRHLLNRARMGQFHEMPLVVALDEAHQFLNKSVGDEYNKVTLDAFGLIAKEGRKYGLTCLLATQRPRDVPEDVLSQIGMFIVHRLINQHDQSVVINASGTIDSSVASFLPNLREGEAMIVGSHAIMPLPIQVAMPRSQPEIPDRKEATWINP